MPKTARPVAVPVTKSPEPGPLGPRVTWPKNLTPALLVAYLENVVTEKTLMNWRSAGEGPPFVKVGGSILYRLASVDRWLDSREKLGLGEAA
jgi:hypothetical protein